MKLPTDVSFDACRQQCAELETITVPSCVRSKRARDTIFEIYAEIERVEAELEDQEGACGCLTLQVANSGHLENIDLIYSYLLDDPAAIVEGLANVEPARAIPEELSCIVGIDVPITIQVD